MELRRRSSTPQDAASRAPHFGNSLRIAPRETSGTEGSNPSSSTGESANHRSLSSRLANRRPEIDRFVFHVIDRPGRPFTAETQTRRWYPLTVTPRRSSVNQFGASVVKRGEVKQI